MEPHNFSARECEIDLDTKALAETEMTHLIDVFGDKVYDAFDPEKKKIRLGKYGYRWFRYSSFLS